MFEGYNFHWLNKTGTFVGFNICDHSIFFHNSYRILPFCWYWNSWIGPSTKTTKIGYPTKFKPSAVPVSRHRFLVHESSFITPCYTTSIWYIIHIHGLQLSSDYNWAPLSILVHLSRKLLKCTIVITCCPSSVVHCQSLRPSLTFHIFDFSSETSEQNSTKPDSKQNLNILYQIVFFRPNGKTRWPPLPLIGWDIFDFSFETTKQNSTKLDRK